MTTKPSHREPRVIAIPPRLHAHRAVHSLVDCLEKMHRVAFTAEGQEPDDLVAHAHAGGDAFVRALHPDGRPPRLSHQFQNLTGALTRVMQTWDANVVVDGVEVDGTSLAHDFRQAGPLGNVRLGPLGSSSCHGAVIVFADWLVEQVVKIHRGGGRTERDPVQPETVREAWTLAFAEMSVDEQDPAIWDRGRQDLDAEYARLMPLPQPNVDSVSALAASRLNRAVRNSQPATSHPRPPRELNDIESKLLCKLKLAQGRPVSTRDLDAHAGIKKTETDRKRRERGLQTLRNRELADKPEGSTRGWWIATPEALSDS